MTRGNGNNMLITAKTAGSLSGYMQVKNKCVSPDAVTNANHFDLSVFACLPGDLNCIAGATSRNGAFIWDVRKGKIITRFNEVTSLH